MTAADTAVHQHFAKQRTSVNVPMSIHRLAFNADLHVRHTHVLGHHGRFPLRGREIQVCRPGHVREWTSAGHDPASDVWSCRGQGLTWVQDWMGMGARFTV